MKKEIKALVFDMDGTLIDSERVHWQAWQETLSALGMVLPGEEALPRFVGVSDEQMALEFCAMSAVGPGPRELVLKKRRVYLGLVGRIRLQPGVRETIDRYRRRFRLAIASSSPHQELIHILAHHGLENQFEYVAGGDMVARKKPDPEIYLKVAGTLGLPPCQCVAFEDSQAGVTSAKAAGLTTVAVPHAMSRDHDFGLADAVLSSLLEFDDALLLTLSGAVSP